MGPKYIINEGEGFLEIVDEFGSSRTVETDGDEMYDTMTGENIGWINGDEANFYDGSSAMIDW